MYNTADFGKKGRKEEEERPRKGKTGRESRVFVLHHRPPLSLPVSPSLHAKESYRGDSEQRASEKSQNGSA